MSRKDKVGYGKPPKETMWKKGKLGNPRGRPKGSGKNQLAKSLKKVLSEKIPATIRGEVQMITQAEAMVRGITKEAIKGNPSAYRAIQSSLPSESGESAGFTVILSKDDSEL